MKKNKKIIIFTGFYLPHLGGVERYTEKLVEQLLKLKYEIVIVTSKHDDDLKNYEKNKISIYRLPTKNLFSQRYPIFKKNKEFYDLINKIEKEKADYFIANTRFYLTTLICIKMAKKYNKNAILIEHGSDHFTVNNKLLDILGAKYEHFITKKIMKYNPKIYGVSKRCNSWLKHFNIKASGVFYNSVDLEAYKKYKDSNYEKVNPEKTTICFAGRIIKEKGVDMLVSAFNDLNKKYDNIELLIAGDGFLKEELEKSNNNNNIKFLGKLEYSEIMSLCNSSNIFVHPSKFPEGLPTTILEAGLMKCAIVATDRGGTIEVINNEKYGIIVEENIKSLKKGLEKLLIDQELLKNLQTNIHNRIINNFTWEKTAMQVIKELKENEKN